MSYDSYHEDRKGKFILAIIFIVIVVLFSLKHLLDVDKKCQDNFGALTVVIDQTDRLTPKAVEKIESEIRELLLRERHDYAIRLQFYEISDKKSIGEKATVELCFPPTCKGAIDGMTANCESQDRMSGRLLSEYFKKYKDKKNSKSSEANQILEIDKLSSNQSPIYEHLSVILADPSIAPNRNNSKILARERDRLWVYSDMIQHSQSCGSFYSEPYKFNPKCQEKLDFSIVPEAKINLIKRFGYDHQRLYEAWMPVFQDSESPEWVGNWQPIYPPVGVQSR